MSSRHASYRSSFKKGATSYNHELEENIRYPFKMKRVYWEKYEVKLQETYGLKKQVLDRMGIRLPLTEKIRVKNVNPGVNETHREEVKAIFSLAGRINKVIITEKKNDHFWLICYDHPLEAVQAVAMFNKQKICGYEVTVTMDLYYGTCLPLGLESIGEGLGPNGLPLTYAPIQVAIHPIKTALETMNCDLQANQFSEDFFDFNEKPDEPITLHKRSRHSTSAEDDSINQQYEPDPEAIIAQMKTLTPNILLPVLITRLKEEQALSKEISTILQEQLMELAHVVAQKTGQNMSDKILKLLQENMQNNQNDPQPNMVQNQRSFNNTQTNPSNVQNPLNPYGLPGLPLPSGPQTPFNLFQNQMQMPLFNPALLQQQQQMQLKAMQQLNPALAQQAMNMSPTQWAPQQNNLNPAMMQQQSLNPAITQQSVNPAITPQFNLNPATQQVNPVIIPQSNQTAAQQNRLVATVASQQSMPAKSPSTSPPMTMTRAQKSQKYPYTKWLPKASESAFPAIRPPAKRPVPGEKSDTLNFSDLPLNVTGSALHSKVKQIGELIFCELLGDGRAMVRFKDEDDAEKCFKLFNGSKVDGQVIKVRYSNLN